MLVIATMHILQRINRPTIHTTKVFNFVFHFSPPNLFVSYSLIISYLSSLSIPFHKKKAKSFLFLFGTIFAVPRHWGARGARRTPLAGGTQPPFHRLLLYHD
jgi:hypothetical protein